MARFRPAHGIVPEPLLSSRSRRWNGIVVELHQFCDVDAVVPAPERAIAVHIAGSISLLQGRNGRTTRRRIRAGDVIVTPVGEPKRWQHAGEVVVVLLKLSPSFVQSIAGEECAIDPARFEIRDNFGTADPQIVEYGRRLLAGLEPEGPASRILGLRASKCGRRSGSRSEPTRQCHYREPHLRGLGRRRRRRDDAHRSQEAAPLH
jgi:hypothetical protein